MPEDQFSRSVLEADLRFLAADELMGRATGTPGIDAAARYIAEQFRAAGAQPAPGFDDFLHPIEFERVQSGKTGKIMLWENELAQGQAFFVLEGGALSIETEAVFVNQGWRDEEKNVNDYNGLDLAGKIAVCQTGFPGATPIQALRAGAQKREFAREAGAVALIEINTGTPPWQLISRFLGSSRIQLKQDDDSEKAPFFHVIADGKDELLTKAQEDGSSIPAKIESPGMKKETVVSSNVVGWIEGSDEKLKEEFVVLSAHYDHVGAGLHMRGATPADSIFNGARDNGIGTAAIMSAARAFGEKPPARSVIFLACTAEEVGLLGSRYYVENPPFPLEKTIFNFNTDGAGYSDTTIVTVIGLERTSAEQVIHDGAGRYDLIAIQDPMPAQNLFDRSDNVNFARQGIPAPNFSPGIRSFGGEIGKRYHQPADEIDADFNFSYVLRFCQAYTNAARRIANLPEQPKWQAGDKYEEAWKILFEDK